ncbi:unnamed protein product [Taenia asiatica]|uniref:Gamma-soluble NSF attachment protein n=1 Tax=Taenia asiatica TaxID=60517 RepID=A0A0R3WB47_TAEAS|nr:unnamed protein product [Taenia asiatica]
MLQESADIYMQAYETASLMFRDLGKFDKVVECIKTAGQLLRQNGVPDSASTLYAKGAKGLEGNMPEDSARFYECAADTSEVEEKYLQAADFAGQSARLWTRLRRFDEADRLLRYQMRLCSLGASGENVHTAYQACGKAVVALVVLKLVQEDSVAAGKVYEEAVEQYHFNETNDAVAVAKLLQAYEPCDSAAMAEVITLPTFRNLETEVSYVSFITGALKIGPAFGCVVVAVSSILIRPYILSCLLYPLNILCSISFPKFARLARSIKVHEGSGDQALSAAPTNAEESEDIC